MSTVRSSLMLFHTGCKISNAPSELIKKKMKKKTRRFTDVASPDDDVAFRLQDVVAQDLASSFLNGMGTQVLPLTLVSDCMNDIQIINAK